LRLILFFVIAGICVSGVEAQSNADSLLQTQLSGTWINTYLKVNVNTENNSTKNRVIEASSSNWVSVLRSKPVVTTFNSDGAYNSVHRTIADSVFYNPSGNWHIAGDTIIMNDTSPRSMTYKFRLVLKSDTAYFWGREDWDNDGKRDDDYYGYQVRADNDSGWNIFSIKKAIGYYFDGVMKNNYTILSKGYHPDANLAGIVEVGKQNRYYNLTFSEWAQFTERPPMVDTTKEHINTIEEIRFQNNIAFVHVKMLWPAEIYHDFITLLKFGDEWKIIFKAWHQQKRL